MRGWSAFEGPEDVDGFTMNGANGATNAVASTNKKREKKPLTKQKPIFTWSETTITQYLLIIVYIIYRLPVRSEKVFGK